MRAPVAIVIPTLNAAPALARLLPDLFEGLEAGLVRVLILSDGGSRDDIAALADQLGAQLITGPAGRGGQLARGAAATDAPWLMFLHADSQLPQGWAGLVRAHIAASGGPVAFGLRFDTGGMAARITAGWANLRSRWFGLAYGDQGLLIARADYARAGGYSDIPLMEDVALARALVREGRKITLLPAAITTSAERYRAQGWLRRGAANLWLLLRYLMGADPRALAARYDSRSEN